MTWNCSTLAERRRLAMRRNQAARARCSRKGSSGNTSEHEMARMARLASPIISVAIVIRWKIDVSSTKTFSNFKNIYNLQKKYFQRNDRKYLHLTWKQQQRRMQRRPATQLNTTQRPSQTWGLLVTPATMRSVLGSG